MKKLMILLCSFAAGVAMAEEYGDLLPEAARDWPRQFLESQQRPDALADGNVYVVTNDVSYSGGPGESALRVAEGASVCVLICEGASLTCRGGDGRAAAVGGSGAAPAFSNETVTVYDWDSWDFTYEMPRFALAVAGDGGVGGQGGGAGIEVPFGSTLEICGSGRLEAIGGAGGDSGSVSGDNHASEMPESLCGTNGLDVATASVSPGESLGPYETAAEATNVMSTAKFAPSAEVEAKLGKGSDALETYCDMFGFAVVPTSDGKWAVEAVLFPEDWTNVVESAHAATRQLPVAKLASQEYGVPLTDVPRTNCVPGFYYSLYSGTAITNVNMRTDEPNRNILCGPNTSITIPLFPHPSPSSGFFAIGVGATRIASDTVRNVAREVGGGLYLGDDDIELDQGFVVIKGTDVRFVGNAVGNEQE